MPEESVARNVSVYQYDRAFGRMWGSAGRVTLLRVLGLKNRL